MNSIISNSLKRSISYQEYRALVKKLSEEKLDGTNINDHIMNNFVSMIQGKPVTVGGRFALDNEKSTITKEDNLDIMKRLREEQAKSRNKQNKSDIKMVEAFYAPIKIDEDKKLIIGAALIPDKHILRVDENGEKFNIFFSKEIYIDRADFEEQIDGRLQREQHTIAEDMRTYIKMHYDLKEDMMDFFLKYL